ncbi:MAG: hypothetical protein HYY06_23375 [Deltaproteobacteria bacterium]|nr:hypothetical protein [Deltaproteobacteria bacterium]
MERRPRGRDEPTVRVAVLVAREPEEQDEIPLIRVHVRSARAVERAAFPAAAGGEIPGKRP